MEEIEHRDDGILRKPTYQPSSQRDDLFIFVIVALECLEVVRAEVELKRNADIVSHRKFGTHLGRAVHQVTLRIVLTAEVDGHFSGSELVRGAEDGGEELLLEGKPAEFGVHTLAGASSPAQFLRFLVALEIVVQLGILNLVLVSLLHSRDDHSEVYVEIADIPWNYAVHTHEGKCIVKSVAVFLKGIFLLDVSAVAERQAHNHLASVVGDELEIKIGGLDGLAGIKVYAVLPFSRTEDV